MLSAELKKIMVLNTIVSVIFCFIIIFVNLYIWEKGKDMMDLAWFGLFQFLFWSSAYALGVKIFLANTYAFLMKICSFVALGVFFFLSFVQFSSEFMNIAVVGSICGLMYGLYYAGLTQVLALYAKGEGYMQFFATRAVINRIIEIGVPLFFALVITQYGFQISFLSMFVLSLWMFCYTFFLPKVSLELKDPEEPFFRTLSFGRVFIDQKLKLASAGMVLGGFFTQFQVIFLLVYTFSVTDNTLYIGLLNVGYSLLVMLFLWIYNRTKHLLRSPAWLGIGIAFIFVGFLIAAFAHSYFLIAANCLLILGNFFFQNNFQGDHFRVMEPYSPTLKIKILLWRELLLTGSRLVMLLLVIFAGGAGNHAFLWLFAAATISALFVPFIHRKLQLP